MTSIDLASLFARHRSELRVHCYRMLGSLFDAEDLVQETFERAWKRLDSLEDSSKARAWLYRIATNACLDALEGRARRVLPPEIEADGEVRPDLPWLEPFPDQLLDESDPERLAVARQSIELAFLAAIQRLPPLQRAALLFRDVLGFSANETATALDITVAAANSALQRARATLPAREARARVTDEEHATLRRYIDAVERADLAAIAAVLAEDVRASMPPYVQWFDGRDALLAALRESWDQSAPHYIGRFRMIETAANGAPGAAGYVLKPGGDAFEAVAVGVLRVEGARVVELVAFHDVRLFAPFGLPERLPIDR